MLATSTMDVLKVRNWYKTCENLVHVTSTIGKLQHIGNLKLAILDTFK